MNKPKDLIEIDFKNSEYENLRNIRIEKNNFLPSLNQNQQWVADKRIDFFNKIQWVSAAAISLTVPLLANRKLDLIILGIWKLHFTNLFLLHVSWILFTLSFFFSLYRNKHHVEYISSQAWDQWLDLEIKEANTTSKAIKVYKSDSAIFDKQFNNYSALGKTVKSKKNTHFYFTVVTDYLSQICLLVAAIFFVVFGIYTL